MAKSAAQLLYGPVLVHLYSKILIFMCRILSTVSWISIAVNEIQSVGIYLLDVLSIFLFIFDIPESVIFIY